MTTKIKNGMSYEKNGWKYVSIKGKPKDLKGDIFPGPGRYEQSLTTNGK
jgi:hypothetical protein